MEATINANKGGLNGLIFGRKGDDFFRFGINSDPTFLIVRDKDRSYASTVEGWTSYKGFRKNDYNKLTIRKIDNMYYFFINEVLVDTQPFEAFHGSKDQRHRASGLEE